MPSGGPRPGSGRPKRVPNPNAIPVLPNPNGTKTKTVSAICDPSLSLPGAKIIDGELVMPEDWQLPLVYMAGILNNPAVDPLRRDRIAQAMAPYCHPKRAEVGMGMKQKAEERAKRAGDGTEWAGILRTVA
jgi:hypothetical protein